MKDFAANYILESMYSCNAHAFLLVKFFVHDESRTVSSQ